MATGTESLARRIAEETKDENQVIDRDAIITLHKDDPREFINLSWNTGKVGSGRGRRTVKLLKRGESTTITLDRAVGHFGPFMIPRDAEDEADERRLMEMREFFGKERLRILMAWGSYPTPAKLSEGSDPVGPCRFPHVSIVVVGPEGDKSEPYDLHEVYGVGEYDAPHLRPSYFGELRAVANTPSRTEKLEDENKELRDRLARLEGQLGALLNQSKKAS